MQCEVWEGIKAWTESCLGNGWVREPTRCPSWDASEEQKITVEPHPRQCNGLRLASYSLAPFLSLKLQCIFEPVSIIDLYVNDYRSVPTCP